MTLKEEENLSAHLCWQVCGTTLSRLFHHAIQKREKPSGTILVCAMQKCDFVLLTDAKVYVEGNKLAIFPSEKIK